MKNILVIGSINHDMTLFMDKIPVVGETVIASDLNSSLGGKGANQAIAATRMGGNVSFIGAVGKDEVAKEVIHVLESNKIDVSGIKESDKETGRAYISIDKSGENNIIVYPGANFTIDKEQLMDNIELFEKADYCLLQLEIPIDTIKEIIAICKKNNVSVFLNPAPYNKGIDDFILNNIDYYIPNETEFLHTIGKDVELEYDLEFYKNEGLKFAKKYSLNLIITLGSKGALLIKENKTLLIKAQKVTPVDTTAAGDSFIGSFLSSFSQGSTIEESLNFASKVAAITISRVGAIDAIPYKEEVI